MSNSVEKLRAVLVLSEQMLQITSCKSWSAIVQLQVKRRALLDAAFPVDSDDNAEQIHALIEKITVLNQQLEQRCQTAKQSVQTDLTGLNKNKKAAAAYLAS